MPEEVALEMTLPPELGDKVEILQVVRARIAEVEQLEQKRRAEKRQRVLGCDAVLRQSWRALRPQPRSGLYSMSSLFKVLRSFLAFIKTSMVEHSRFPLHFANWNSWTLPGELNWSL